MTVASSVSFAVLSLVWCAVAPAATWTVAQFGPADFTEIQDAIAAASDGDVILVSPGSYSPFVIDGKGLSIVAKNGASMATGFGTPPLPNSGSVITIKNLAAHQSCVIENVQFTNFVAAPAAMLVADNVGAVWVQHMFLDSYNATALRVERSSAVSIHDCLIQTNSIPAANNGTPQSRPGVAFVGSRATVVSSRMRGSHNSTQGSGFPVPNAPANGGAGCDVVDSIVELLDAELDGGSGGTISIGGCSKGGDGGPGLVLASAGSTPPFVSLRGTTIQGGFGGFNQAGCGAAPENGPPTIVLAGALHTEPAPARVIGGDGDAGLGKQYSLTLSGGAFEQVLLFAGEAGPSLPLGVGAIHIVTPMHFLGVVPLSSSGVLPLEFTVPAMPSVGAVVVAIQAFYVTATGSLIASGPLAIAID